MAWDEPALDNLASYCRSQRTTGLPVVENRRSVLERSWSVPAGSEIFERRYLHGCARDGALREDVASPQKSLVALLTAIAVDCSRLDLEQPVSKYIGRGWSCAEPGQEGAIVVRHLLEMCSGLDDALRFKAPAGVCHHNNTQAYPPMLQVLDAAADQSIGALRRTWLTDPAGMADTAWCLRGDELAFFLDNPRGLARLGQIVLNGGVAEDVARLVSPCTGVWTPMVA